MDKKFRLPKDAFIDDEDVVGHGIAADDETPEASTEEDPETEDVEGHGLTILPPPPSIGLRRSPGHGGELQPTDVEIEGIRRA